MLMILVSPPVDQGFTRVPNNLLTSGLTPGQVVCWIRLSSLVFSGEDQSSLTIAQIANAFGVNENTMHWQLKELEKAGGLVRSNGVITLCIPQGTPQEDFDSISEEVAAEGRKRHQITQKEASKAIAKAWNECRPANWPVMGKSVHPTAMMAIEKQAKRLKIERQDYESLIVRVCAGIRKHPWWSQRDSMKIHSVFGWGVNLQDKDFLKVKELYELGAGGMKDAFDWKNDEHILAWYASKEVDFTSVLRIEADTKEEIKAWYDDESNYPADSKICVIASIKGADSPEIWPKMSQLKFLYFPTEV